MSKLRSDKAYRVVVIQGNGRRDIVDAQLTRVKADAVRNSLLAMFPEVLVQEERRSGCGPSQIGDTLPYPE